MATKSKKQLQAEELREMWIGVEARKRLRENALHHKKHVEDEGRWSSGLGIGSGQVLALLDYIDELENKVFDKQVQDKFQEE